LSDELLLIREPTLADAAALWQLVRQSGVLDLNSPYSYLILCHHFADTCLVAERHGEIVGFVTGYRPPRTPEVIFVWQIGVATSMRGRGLGVRILEALVRKNIENGATFLEATVTPSNAPSQALFRSMARRFHTQCVETLCFSERNFPESGHEAEYLFRIGPFVENRATALTERSA
jgi:L-2,4-diaminobutyric acid acetyltransferase